jgi:hypothetical protein
MALNGVYAVVSFCMRMKPAAGHMASDRMFSG